MAKQLKSRWLSSFFCLLREGTGSEVGAGSVQINTDPDSDPGGPKHIHPEHCREGLIFQIFYVLDQHFSSDLFSCFPHLNKWLLNYPRGVLFCCSEEIPKIVTFSRSITAVDRVSSFDARDRESGTDLFFDRPRVS